MTGDGPQHPGTVHLTTGAPRRQGHPPAQERGRRRRQALVRAAAELLHEGGSLAVTHRAVARRAHLPLAATTYYFASRDELVAEAFTLLVAGELAALRAAATGPDPFGALLSAAQADRPRQIGLWELYVQAGRDPALQQVARAWTDGCGEILAGALGSAGHSPAPDDVRLLAALLTGLWLRQLVEERPHSAQEAHVLLGRALALLERTD
ncbi:TetR/AcrR family transcriptional regulator [Streptosporangium canum]|uniref:TetR/AcrR family transcriptional regulator n=1 Tax=Streptosporangium canum TaxID=324952 RepID=UPI0033BC376D